MCGLGKHEERARPGNATGGFMSRFYLHGCGGNDPKQPRVKQPSASADSARQASGRPWAWCAPARGSGVSAGADSSGISLVCLAVSAGVCWALDSSHMGVSLGFPHGDWAQGQAPRERTKERGS